MLYRVQLATEDKVAADRKAVEQHARAKAKSRWGAAAVTSYVGSKKY